MGQVVRRNRNPNAVSRQNTDVMTSHTPRKLTTYGRITLIQLDGVLATTEGVLNDTLHFQKITLTH